MSCFFSMPFSNNPYITPWGTVGPDGKPEGAGYPKESTAAADLPDISYAPGIKGLWCRGDRYPYHVQPGDTLSGIAKRLEVSLADIITANHGIDPLRLAIGQTICIPACPPEHSARYIQPGDTLAGIAKEYGLSPEIIIEANPGIDPDYLRIGQRLCIPKYSKADIP